MLQRSKRSSYSRRCKSGPAYRRTPSNKMAEDKNEDEFGWRWFLDDPRKPIELCENRLSITFHARKSSSCTGIRGDKALHRNMEHWFQVKMDGPFQGQARMVGVGLHTTCLHSNSKDFYPLIGKDSGSWGFNYNGQTHHDSDFHEYASIDHSKRHITSMVVGVYYNSYFGSLVFSLEDESLGLAFDSIPSVAFELYPMVCSSSRNSKMELLQCGSSVCSLKSLCRGTIRLYLNKKQDDIQNLPIPSHLKAYLNFQHYEHPKDYYSLLNLKSLNENSRD